MRTLHHVHKTLHHVHKTCQDVRTPSEKKKLYFLKQKSVCNKELHNILHETYVSSTGTKKNINIIKKNIIIIIDFLHDKHERQSQNETLHE